MHEELLARGRFVCTPVPLTQLRREERCPVCSRPLLVAVNTGERACSSPHCSNAHGIVCLCGEEACDYLSSGYPFCRPHDEHHRGPECPIDSLGRPAPTWEDAP